MDSDFLIEKWDAAGNIQWSRTYDRSTSIDILHDVLVVDGHAYAVGQTAGGTAGGTDGIVLNIDLLTGDLIDSILWGGTADDLLYDLAILSNTLFAVGTTSSYGAGGSDVALVSFALPRGAAPAPATLALVGLGIAGIGFLRRKRVTQDLLWVFLQNPVGFGDAR